MNFKGIVKLSEEQYQELKLNGSITVGDTTVNYSPNDTLYLTPDEANFVSFDTEQDLTELQKSTARSNIGALGDDALEDVVSYTSQTVSEDKKAIARANIGAISIDDIPTGGTGDISGLVSYEESQTLTDEQKTTARTNISAVSSTEFQEAVNSFSDTLTNDIDPRLIFVEGETWKIGDASSLYTGTVDDSLLSENVAMKNANNNFSTSQTINGDLVVSGNIIQQGESYITEAEVIKTSDDYIVLRNNAISGLTDEERSGLEFNLYDGTNSGRLAVDNKGIVRVGDIGSEQPLATREETPLNGGFAKWDNSLNQFVTESVSIPNIVYSELEPENPVEGMIWLKPAE